MSDINLSRLEITWTENLRIVSIGEMASSDTPDDVLVAFGLGSCVAVCLYDPVARVGGLLHALLPTRPNGSKLSPTPTKYVDQGVPLLIDSLLKLGARRTRLVASLCGGTQMLPWFSSEGQLEVGKRNVLAAEAALHAARIRVRASATGGQLNRTVRFYPANGQVRVKTMQEGEQILS